MGSMDAVIDLPQRKNRSSASSGTSSSNLSNSRSPHSQDANGADSRPRKPKDEFIGTGESLGLPDKLAFLAAYSESNLAVIAKRGQGKSLLAEYLLDEFAGLSPVVFYAAEDVDEDDLLRQLGKDFGLSLNKDQSVIEQLTEFAGSAKAQGKKALVIIDDAHQLKDRSLKALFSFSERTSAGLVLFARHSITKKPSYRQSANLYQCELNKLGQEHLESYIRRKNQSEVELSEVDLESIMARSGGRFDRVDEMIDELGDYRRPKRSLPLVHLSVLVVLVLVAAAVATGNFSFGLKDDGEPAPTVSQPIALPAEKTPVVVTENPLAEITLASKSEPIEALAVAARSDKALPDTLNATKIPSNNGRLSSNSLPAQGIDVSNVEVGVETVTLAKPARRKLGSGADLSIVAALQAGSNDSVAATTFRDVKLPTARSTSSRVGRQANFVKPAQDEALPEILSKSWITTARTSEYTLQLMGSQSEAGIAAFINEQPNREKFSHFQTNRQNQSWYVLIWGRFESRKAALAAIETMPSSLRQQKPWARGVASIQSVLVRN